MRYGLNPNSKFKAISGQVVVTGDIMDAIKYDVDPREINPHMSKEIRNGCLCRYHYYDQRTQFGPYIFH